MALLFRRPLLLDAFSVPTVPIRLKREQSLNAGLKFAVVPGSQAGNNDFCGNYKVGAVNNSPTLVPASYGPALNFGGPSANQYVQYPLTHIADGDFTITAIVKFSANSNGNDVTAVSLSVPNYSNYYCQLGAIYNAGAYSFGFAMYNGSSNPIAYIQTPVLNREYVLTGVRSISSNNMYLYVNGVLLTAINNSQSAFTSPSSYTSLNIGGDPTHAARAFTGSIAGVFLWDRAQSSQEVAEVALRRFSLFEPDYRTRWYGSASLIANTNFLWG